MEPSQPKIETQYGISATADFEENTWTFEMPENFKVWAGEFAIVPKIVHEAMQPRWVKANCLINDEQWYMVIFNDAPCPEIPCPMIGSQIEEYVHRLDYVFPIPTLPNAHLKEE